jgi:hypothetical protein
MASAVGTNDWSDRALQLDVSLSDPHPNLPHPRPALNASLPAFSARSRLLSMEVARVVSVHILYMYLTIIRRIFLMNFQTRLKKNPNPQPKTTFIL